MLGLATILTIVDTNDVGMHVSQQWLCGGGTKNPGVAGITGVVILFNVTDDFTHRPVSIFSLVICPDCTLLQPHKVQSGLV
jgi:hypothetical protein